MKPRATFLMLSAAMVLTVGACTMGQAQPSGDPRDAAATIVAATLKAEGITTSAAPSATPNSPAAPSSSPTVTATAKPAVQITANGAACRSGPSANSEILTTLGAGTTVDMIAKDSADGYWMVKDPVSGSSCWVQMQDGTASGSHTLLPEVTPQATEAQPSTPARPGSSANFNYWEYSCGGGTVSLQWLDNADNETGYRIYRNGQVVAELPAGSTSYTDAIYLGIGPLEYSIRAYNDAGESASLSTPDFSC